MARSIVVIDNGGGARKDRVTNPTKMLQNRGIRKPRKLIDQQNQRFAGEKTGYLYSWMSSVKSDDIGNLFLVFLVEVVRGIV